MDTGREGAAMSNSFALLRGHAVARCAQQREVSMKRSWRKATLIAVVVGMILVPLGASAVGGFNSPLFGMDAAPTGGLLVADTGAGIQLVREGEIRNIVELPGVTDVDTSGGVVWAITTGFDPESDSGQAIYRISGRNPIYVANLFEFEATDPDGAGVDSNPFDVESLGRGGAVVADAGGNDLLRVSRNGAIRVMALFPDEVVSTANLQELAGCAGTPIPDLAFICDIPAMPAQAVPTSIAAAPNGDLYVGELKGFPAPTGESNIWRVSPHARDADCGASRHCTLAFDGGFTSIIDMTFGPDGLLYVAELDELSWFAVEFGIPSPGGTINACDVDAGTCVEVATGIPMLTAIAFDTHGTLWATQNALVPGLAEVVEVP